MNNKQSQELLEQDTKTRILTVSLDLFAEKGFEGTGINEIAEKAGITKSVIYYHFKNKDAILKAIFDAYIEQAMDMKRSLAQQFYSDGKAAGQLEIVVDEMFNFVLENRKVMKILLMESIKNSDEVPLFSFWDRNMNVGEGIIQRMGLKIDSDPSSAVFLEAFFMLVLPLVGYAVLEEKWSDHFGMDEKKMRKTFERIYKINLEEYWFDRLFGPSSGLQAHHGFSQQGEEENCPDKKTKTE